MTRRRSRDRVVGWLPSLEAHKRATFDDLLAAPDHLVAEILFGSLVTSPRPAPRHANAASVLGGRLDPRWQLGDGGPGGWWFRLDGGAWVRHTAAHDDRAAALPPFDAVPLDVSELWLD